MTESDKLQSNKPKNDTKEQEVKELLPKLEVGIELLNKFVEYSEKYKNNIGVYLICVKENKVDDIIELLDEKIRTKIKSNMQFNNDKLSTSKFKNLFYIGKTENKDGFQGRVNKQHIRGTNKSSFSRNLLCCIDSEYNNLKRKKEHFYKFQSLFLKKISKNKWKEFFQEYFDIYVLPLSKASTTLCAESTLIYVFQPPINKDGCDENIFVTSD